VDDEDGTDHEQAEVLAQIEEGADEEGGG